MKTLPKERRILATIQFFSSYFSILMKLIHLKCSYLSWARLKWIFALRKDSDLVDAVGRFSPEEFLKFGPRKSLRNATFLGKSIFGERMEWGIRARSILDTYARKYVGKQWLRYSKYFRSSWNILKYLKYFSSGRWFLDTYAFYVLMKQLSEQNALKWWIVRRL